MHSPFTIELLKLEGTGEINRKQLRDWSGRSLSYVDQRMRGDEQWGEQEKDRIIKKAFEMEIAPIVDLYTGNKVLFDLDYMGEMIDGHIGQELKELQRAMGQLIEDWDEHRRGQKWLTACKKGVMLFATIQKEFEKRQ